jgi:predicted nuclease of predicted toxin-antitoxin system
MKVLLDECTPRALKRLIIDQGFECATVQEAGWAGQQNGELLSIAEVAFDALVTVDTNLQYQQSMAGRRIAIIILLSSSNRLDHLRQYFPEVLSALKKIKPGEIIQVGTTS